MKASNYMKQTFFYQISNHKEQNVEEKKLEQKSEYFEEKCKKILNT
jgi:hypothetical protein